MFGPFVAVWVAMQCHPRSRLLAHRSVRTLRTAVKDRRISRPMRCLLTFLAFAPIPGEADEFLCIAILWLCYRQVVRDAWQSTAVTA
jgi:hypothetical protein